MKAKMKLYDKSNIEELQIEGEEKEILEYIKPFVKEGVQSFISNVITEIMVLSIDDKILPITINEKEYKNSHVCSPYTHYISYAKEELKNLDEKFLKTSLSIVLSLLGCFLKWGKINKIIQVNNLFFSTNLLPKLTKMEIVEITNFLKEKFPKHTILFKNLNDRDKDMISFFKKEDYDLVPTKQVYIFNPRENQKSDVKRAIKNDEKLFEQIKNQEINENEESDNSKTIRELYQKVYLDKYSENNAKFTEKYFFHILKNRMLHFITIKDENKIEAFSAYMIRSNKISHPLIGHDTEMPKEKGLYRMISYLIYRKSKNDNIVWNQSGGAATFKKRRGAKAEIEYYAVYTKHLRWRRRICWYVLSILLNKIAVPLIKKKGL